MGVKGPWFRRRPSDDEMRGNMLQTRESMRGVWLADWWDVLRQDARFTWRSWRRQPGFAVRRV